MQALAVLAVGCSHTAPSAGPVASGKTQVEKPVEARFVQVEPASRESPDIPLAGRAPRLIATRIAEDGARARSRSSRATTRSWHSRK